MQNATSTTERKHIVKVRNKLSKPVKSERQGEGGRACEGGNCTCTWNSDIKEDRKNKPSRPVQSERQGEVGRGCTWNGDIKEARKHTLTKYPTSIAKIKNIAHVNPS
eukprot:scaffold35957_cov39-Attheya_sp.AAC.1